MRTSLLLPEPTLQVLPSLAIALGLERAIVLQQLYWLLNPEHNNGRTLSDGERYIYNTYEEWQQKYFLWWSPRAVQRIFMALEKDGWIVAKQPEGGISRRKYYRISSGQSEHLTYERLASSISDRIAAINANASSNMPKMDDGTCQKRMIDVPKTDVPYNRDNRQREQTETIHCEDKPRDERLTALASLDSPNLSEANWKLAGKALAAIVASTPSADANEIKRRAANYRTHFTYAITSSALAKWWGRCAKPKAKTRQELKESAPEPWPLTKKPPGVENDRFEEWHARKTWVCWCRENDIDPENPRL